MSEDRKILIVSPPYNDKSGGIIVLHKLCHILNSLGRKAYIYPHYVEPEKTGKKVKDWSKKLKYQFKQIKKFKTNSAFNTPTHQAKEIDNWDEWLVIYPEIIDGNPLGAKNIIRWLLHQPGYHTGRVDYGRGELYFKFNSAINDFSNEGSTTSETELKVIHYPTELYNEKGTAAERKGTAYCLRKGKDKAMVHDLSDSVLIDNLSHAQVAEVFKRSKQFISYDALTAYSIFAVLCGCESIVIPDEGVSIDEWYPDLTDRYGIAYGFENLDHARQTKSLVLERIKREEALCTKRVEKALSEMDQFFSA